MTSTGSHETLRIVLALLFFIPLLLLALFSSSQQTEAGGIFSPFGGRVISWIPDFPGCAPITAAIAAATFGVVNVTVGQLQVTPPHGGAFGILKINGFIPPVLTTIYKNGDAYQKPGSYVLGNAIDLCGVCGGGKKDGPLGAICGSVGRVMGPLCGVGAQACPINRIVHKIGSS